ncbi:ABC transporter substrate-binding protein [Cytobacillus oceanisediminis]|uniref:ABC transporter substrate-binding protein n=1 Tax=Cytobacillus oceanisediminis TaxID=665099 RepID=UPI001CCDB805|nr:ABC transporter substrate-binding protein [Cytobacillus oceanisediminis]MBZ9537028.1 ABC transporter substrate-binding protein [Cytobacillus oceanisediminis]
MKKWSITLLVLLLSLSAILTGCKSNEQTSGENVESSKISGAGEFPIVEEKITLKVLAAQRAFVEDYATNEFTKWFEEKTNIHLEWEVVPEGDESKQKLNLTLASGDYPDIYLNMPISAQQLEVYGSQGAFLPLNDLIDKYGVETKRVFEQKPSAKEMATSNDGNIYTMPSVNECYQCLYPVKLWINQAWLDKLGLDMPTTTEEYYQVLKAFKTQDPNGNGKMDEVPLTGIKNSWNTEIIPSLMNSFIFTKSVVYDGAVKYTYLNDEKIDVTFNKPEWREGLEYMRKLYAEGLISPESFTQDQNQALAISENEKALGSIPAGYQLVFTNLESGLYKDYAAVPPLKGPNGAQYAEKLNNDGVSLGKFVISSSTKHPEAAFRLADALYNDDVMMRAIYGVEGEDWRAAKEGEVGLDGSQAKYFEFDSGEEMQNNHWNKAAPEFQTKEFLNSIALGNAENIKDNVIYIVNQETDKYVPHVDEEILVPPLILNDQQSQEILDIQKSIYDYVEEMNVRFIIGDADLDKEWDTYIETINGMNLQGFLDILQESYDARYGN